MFKHLLLFLTSVFLCQSLTCQTYDISQYKARYERRPFFEIYPQFRYESGKFIPQSISASLPFQFSIRQNTEAVSNTISFSGSAARNKNRIDFPSQTTINNLSSIFNLDMQQQFFNGRNGFWGYRGNVTMSGSRTDQKDAIVDQKTRRLNIEIRPGVFIGFGRIEYAEDAQLANFIMDDLVKAGAIAGVYIEETGYLAERITSIIGDRTFGPRGRHIHQLRKLYDFFNEREIEVLDEFQLFAALNDNWLYANRIELPHGEQLTIGIDGVADYEHSNLSFTSNFDAFFAGGAPYISYQHAKVVRKKASRSWLLSLSAEYSKRLDDATVVSNPFVLQILKRRQISLRAGYSYAVVPISRTLFRFNLNTSINSTSIGIFSPNIDASLPSYAGFAGSFFLNYFITGQLRFQLGGSFDYRHDLIFSSNSIHRTLNFNLQYAFF